VENYGRSLSTDENRAQMGSNDGIKIKIMRHCFSGCC